MADFRNPARYGQVAGTVRTDIDAGLRAYMLRVYNYMAIALALTGVAAYGTFNLAVADGQLTPLGNFLFASAFRWVVILAPLAMVLFLSFRVHRMSVASAQMTFWVYSVLVGVSLATLFMVYTATSITQTFFIAAAAFGALSLYGYTTKRDLSAMGAFMVMGLFGLIIAMVINIFLQSSGLQWAISIIGLLVFSGLTAWDTQKIKNMYDVVASDETMMGRTAIMGALSLYLDFLNMFMFLLQFMGNRE